MTAYVPPYGPLTLDWQRKVSGSMGQLTARVQQFTHVVDYGATGQTASESDKLSAATATGYMVHVTNGSYNFDGVYQPYWDARFRTVQSADVQGAIFGEYIQVTNPTSKTGYGIRKAYYNFTGNISGNPNDTADALLIKYDNITSGSAWGHWDVIQSPLNPSSGLTGAPTGPQAFALVIGEGNPQNRHSDAGWTGETRRGSITVGGYQMVPETQDFTSTLGNVRPGYPTTFGFLVSKSAYTSTLTNRHARTYNGFMCNPNAIAPGGYFALGNGFLPFVTAATISNAGSGYSVGDFLTFNSGSPQASNEDTQLRVLAVGGGGAITSVEVWNGGFYNNPPSSPVGVTGGAGTGATFTYTLATQALEIAQAWGGINGQWNYGLDAAMPFNTTSNLGGALFVGAMFRAPNNQKIIVARNAANNADVELLTLDGSNIAQIGKGASGYGVNLSALGNYANDSAAATGGVAVGQLYRNGSALMVRVA